MVSGSVNSPRQAGAYRQAQIFEAGGGFLPLRVGIEGPLDMRTGLRARRSYHAVNFAVTVKTSSRLDVVRLSGELDFCSAQELTNTIYRLTPGASRLVVLELAELTFCDAGGISAMLRAQRSVNAAGARLMLHGASAHVRKILRLTRADEALELL